MSHLKFYAYEGFGPMAQEKYGYNQAVRVGDNVEISGQGAHSYAVAHITWQPPESARIHLTLATGGWDSKGVIFRDYEKQIQQAFVNVETCLRDAGAKGWEQVYKGKTGMF